MLCCLVKAVARRDHALRELELSEAQIRMAGPTPPNHPPPPSALLGPEEPTPLPLRLKERARTPERCGHDTSRNVRPRRSPRGSVSLAPAPKQPMPPPFPPPTTRVPPTPPRAVVFKAMPKLRVSAGSAAEAPGTAWPSSSWGDAGSSWAGWSGWSGWWDDAGWSWSADDASGGGGPGGKDASGGGKGGGAAAPRAKGPGGGKGGKGPDGSHLVTKRGGWMSRVAKLADVVLHGSKEEIAAFSAKLWTIIEHDQAQHGSLKPWGLKASILLGLVTTEQTAEAEEMARSINWSVEHQLAASLEDSEIVSDTRRNHLGWD